MNKLKVTILSVAMVVASALPAMASYTVDPTNAAAINDMATSSTGSFMALFVSNWPTIATFAITIVGFFFVWNLLMGFFKQKHH